MRWRNTASDYGLVTRCLHWSTAVLIIGLLWLGWYLADLSYFDAWYEQGLHAHRALGLLVPLLGVLTLAWRRVSPSPPPVASLARWERVLGNLVHHALFLMVFAIPLTGYLVSTTAGKSIDVFDGFEVPALFKVGSNLRDFAHDAHEYLAWATVVLVALHAGAALKHQLFDRDGTLARMLWR